MKQNWKTLKSLMEKNKKSLHKEVLIDGVSTTDTTKSCNSFGNYIIDHPKNIQESIPFSNSHHLDQIINKERSMYFRHATETEIFVSIMQMNKLFGINYVSRKFLLMCKKSRLILLKGTIQLL